LVVVSTPCGVGGVRSREEGVGTRREEKKNTGGGAFIKGVDEVRREGEWRMIREESPDKEKTVLRSGNATDVMSQEKNGELHKWGKLSVVMPNVQELGNG